MTAVFESVRVRFSTIPFIKQHAARLERAALGVGLAAPPDAARAMWRYALNLQEAALRVTWDGASLSIEERLVSKAQSMRLATVREPYPGYPWKSVDRSMFDRGIAEAEQAGADEALFVDAGGHVTEAARFAVGWLDGSTVAFPPLDMRVLPSIARERVIELALELGLDAVELRVPPSALVGRPVFLANAVRGILPVTELDGASLPSDDRLTTLRQQFWPRGSVDPLSGGG